MITVAVANRNANTGASTTTPGIVDHMAAHASRKSGSHMTQRWREGDSNHRSP